MKEQNFIVRIFLSVILACLVPTEMFAQKDIEKLVSKYSDKPYTVYTCIVRRNPRTRKVSKVIKSLTIANSSVYRQFESAFRTAGKSADYVNTSNSNGGFSSVLKFDRSAYIFSSEGGSQCTITVIWRDDDGSDNMIPEDKIIPELNPTNSSYLRNELGLMTRNIRMRENQFSILENMISGLEDSLESSAAQIDGSEKLLKNFNDFSIEVLMPEN